MKKLLLSAFALFSLSTAFGTVHVISTSGSAFIPATVTTAVSGDSLVFVISSGHTATSVSQATWNANGTSPNGMFNYTQPGGMYIIPSNFTGTIYYVCVFHAGSGMKGQVQVGPNTGIDEKSNDIVMSIYPNPTQNFLNIKTEGLTGKMNVRVLDVLGAEVMPAVNVDASFYNVNVTALAAGTYFIRVENGDRAKVVRFMKK